MTTGKREEMTPLEASAERRHLADAARDDDNKPKAILEPETKGDILEGSRDVSPLITGNNSSEGHTV